MPVQILSLNLWNVAEPLDARLAALCSGLERMKPDIMCFQEVSAHPRLLRMQSEIIAERCHFAHHAYSLSGHWGSREEGLAILSRHPIVGSLRVALPEFSGDMARQVFLAELAIGSRRVLVANTHLAFPVPMTRERSSQAAVVVSAIKDYGERLRVPSVVLCGDFNDAPDSPAIRTILDGDPGFLDAFASCHPQCQGRTFSSANHYVDPALEEDGRIDYIFAGGGLRVNRCKIVFDGRDGLEIVSDHFGLFCALEFA